MSANVYVEILKICQLHADRLLWAMKEMNDQCVVELQHYFQQQPAIRLVILFGSVASNRAHFESDIDVD